MAAASRRAAPREELTPARGLVREAGDHPARVLRVKIDHISRHHERRVTQEEADRRRDIRRPEDAAQRLRGVRLLQPVIALDAALQGVLVVRRAPAHFDAVYPDAVRCELRRVVARECGRGRLGDRVCHQERRAALARHRRDVDDGAADASFNHVPRRSLRDEERRSRVARHHRVPVLGGRRGQVATSCRRCSIHHSVDGPHRGERQSHRLARTGGVGEVRLDEKRFKGLLHSSGSLKPLDRLCAPLGVAGDDCHLGGAAGLQLGRNLEAEALCPASDEVVATSSG
mmetsp:Transcript_36261/g.120034  ORF Transcript_36261/g.120034 Transcript_36261/m.120034 type:complete len:286 (-) Transcript_36261:60-917(-)